MSVYIPGMEMPTSPVLFCIHPDGKVFADLEGGWREYKAIPVPYHGRLIDADALHEEMYALEYARENEWLDGIREARGVDVARVALLDAPTIIPKSGGTEDE